MVWDAAAGAAEDGPAPTLKCSRSPACSTALAPLVDAWRDLVAFAAAYYQRALGRSGAGRAAAATARPDARSRSAAARGCKRAAAAGADAARRRRGAARRSPPSRQAVLDALSTPAAGPLPAVRRHRQRQDRGLPARRAERCWRATPTAQALVMVPEINLTPQLRGALRRALRRRPHVVSLHSGMTHPQRLRELAGGAHAARRASCWARAWRCSPRCRACG